MIEPEDAVVVLQGPQEELARAAETLARRGIGSQILCPQAGSS